MVQPNIIFIVLDTLRADRVFGDNKNQALMPFLNDLIKKSYYFENCISNSPWTLPSHIAMFTGLSPTETSLISGKIDRINNRLPLLAEILREMGYSTSCFSENAFISKSYGLTRGFDNVLNVWDWNPWVREKYPLGFFMRLFHKIDRMLQNLIGQFSLITFWKHFYNRSQKIIKKIIKELFLGSILFTLKNDTRNDILKFEKIIESTKANKPQFVFFNFITPHDPYVPLKEVMTKGNVYLNDFKNLSDLLIENHKARLDINLKDKKLSRIQIKSIEKLYNSCVYSTDIILEFLFNSLQRLNLLNNSYIVITSDHGEHLAGINDHYLWEHNTYQSVYDPLIRVPLIIYNKDIDAKIIKNQVQLKDIFHSIIDLTGKDSIFLESHKSIIKQVEKNMTPKYIFGEYLKSKDEMSDLLMEHRKSIDPSLYSKIFNHLYFLRSNNFKYIRYNNTEIEEFYDLTKDPLEKQNIITDNPEEYEKMRTFMNNLLKSLKNKDNLESIVTKKEKNTLKQVLGRLKISGI